MRCLHNYHRVGVNINTNMMRMIWASHDVKLYLHRYFNLECGKIQKMWKNSRLNISITFFNASITLPNNFLHFRMGNRIPSFFYFGEIWE